MEKMSQWLLQEFLDRAASGEATPGGGSVAALTGALAASMVAMVANLTVGRPRYAAVEGECLSLLGQATDRRSELQKLMEADVRAFETLMKAFRIPKGDSPEQQYRRQQAIQSALREAIEVPLAAARTAMEILRMAARLVEIGNGNAISDAGVAACLGEAAVAAALLNVDINLKTVTDAEFAAAARRERRSLAEEAARLRMAADQILQTRLAL